MKAEYAEKTFEKFWLLNTDISPLVKKHSPTLPNRRYVYKPNNQVKGNRPVEVGYEFSTVGLSCRQPLYGLSSSVWNLPLSMRLVPAQKNKNSFTADQVNDLLSNKELPFANDLVVNALDSNYSSPEYIAQTHSNPNLVNVIRLASNRNVWKKLSEQEVEQRRSANEDNRGADAIYGQKYKLNEIEQWDLPIDKQNRFGIKLGNGKACIVAIDLWEDMMLRSKRKHNMKDKPFSLVRVRLLDPQTEKPLFKKCMWLGVWGQRRIELSLEEIFWCYRNRFDAEHFFRFGKQKLLLDKYQTPDEEHLANWLEVVSLAYWMLWAAEEEAVHCCHKWQQYDNNFKKRKKYGAKLTPSQVQLQLANIILGFEQTPFLPKPQKKGKGRKTGQTQTKRKKYPVLKKKKRKKQKVK